MAVPNIKILSFVNFRHDDVTFSESVYESDRYFLPPSHPIPSTPPNPGLIPVGWFARDPLVFKKVGDVLFADPRTSTPQTSTRDSDQRKIATWLVAGDAFEQLTEGGGKGEKGEEGEGGTAFEIFKAIAPVREELSKVIGPPIKVAAGELEGMGGDEGWKNQIWPVQVGAPFPIM